jgi:hypothetical protein
MYIGNSPFQGLVSGGNIIDASIEGVDLSTSAIAARLGYTPVDPGAAVFSANPTISSGTVGAVPYLNGTKVLVSSNNLLFDGSKLTATGLLLIASSQTFLGDNGLFSGSAADGNTVLSYYTGKYLAFKEGISEQMRLSSGTLSIGPSSGAGGINIGSSAGRTQYQYINFGGAVGGTDFAWQIGRNPSTAGIAPADGFYIYDLKANTSRLVIDTAGEVGIGTANPQSPLHIYTPTIATDAKVTALRLGSLYNGGDARNAITFWGSTDTDKMSEIVNGWDNAGSYLAVYTRNQLGGLNNTDANITEKLRVNSAGRLLLGTSTNTAGFSTIVLNGGPSANNSGIQLGYGASTFGGGAITTANAAGGGLTIWTYTGAVGSESYNRRIDIKASGLVGINTSDPKATLDVAGGLSVSGWSNNNSGSAGGLEIGWDGSQGLVQSINRVGGTFTPVALNGNIVKLIASGTEVLRVHSNNNVGISNTAPQNKLTVNTPSRSDNETNSIGQLVVAGPISSAVSHDFTASTAIFRVQGSNATNNLQFGVGDGGYSFHPWIQASFDNSNSSFPSDFGTKDILLQPIAGNVGVGTSSPSTEGRLTIGSAGVTDKNGIVLNRGLAGSVSATQAGIFNEWNGIGSGESLTLRSPNGYKFQNNTGSAEWVRITGSGSFLVGETNNYNLRAIIAGPAAASSTGSGSYLVASLADTNAMTAGVGGGLGFQGNDGVNGLVTFATINGSKENSTSGNYASYLSFKTRANGQGLTERMTISSNGDVSIPGGIQGKNPTYQLYGSNFNEAGLTASNRIKLGVFYPAQGGMDTTIRLFVGAGYNAAPEQVFEYVLRLRTSNGSSNTAGSTGPVYIHGFAERITVEPFASAHPVEDFIVEQINTGQYVVYFNPNSLIGNYSHYIVEAGYTQTWVHTPEVLNISAITGNYITINTWRTRAITDTLGYIANTCGINFPSTQRASSSPNTLDDYEEGTWNPTPGGLFNVNYAYRQGTYVKVGRIVTVFWDFSINNSSGGGDYFLYGLPFPVATDQAGYSVLHHRDANIVSSGAAGTQLKGFAQTGATYMVLQADNSGTNGWGTSSNVNYTNSGRHTGYCTYTTQD